MIGLENQGKKIQCRQHQKSIRFLSLNLKAKNKLLCSRCTQSQSIPLNQVNELLIDINQDHPMNFHIVELQHQFSNLKKELTEKVDQILNETEKELNGLIAIKLSDKFIQHYLYDDQLHDYDFEKLQELLCKYYEFEADQIVARIPQQNMEIIYSVQMKCQKLQSIIQSFNKPKYYTKITSKPESDCEEIQVKKEVKNDTHKHKELFKLIEDVQVGSACHCLSFNNAGTKIVCGLQGNEKQDSLIVMKLIENKFSKIQVLQGHVGAVFSVVHSKLSNKIFSAGEDKSIRIWKSQNGSNHTYDQIINEAHNDVIYCIALNQNENLIASGCKSGVVKIWFQIEEQWVEAQILEKHQNWVKSLSFNFDSTFLASGSGDNTVIIWKLDEDWEYFQTLSDHTGYVNTVNFGKLDKQKTILASGSEDQQIRIWEMVDKKFVCTQQLDGGYYVRSVCFNFNSLLLVTGSYSNIKIWVRNSSGKYVLNQEKYFDSRNVVFSEDSKLIGSVNRFSINLRIFKIKGKREKHEK